MAIVPAIRITKKVYYLPNPVHRNRTRGKSQWVVPEADELDCFRMARREIWLLTHVGWGLHFVDNRPAYLGVAQDHSTYVFVARFVNDENHSAWHGYPADHQNNNQDIPADVILKKWLIGEILPARKIRKLAKGQPCSL